MLWPGKPNTVEANNRFAEKFAEGYAQTLAGRRVLLSALDAEYVAKMQTNSPSMIGSAHAYSYREPYAVATGPYKAAFNSGFGRPWVRAIARIQKKDLAGQIRDGSRLLHIRLSRVNGHVVVDFRGVVFGRLTDFAADLINALASNPDIDPRSVRVIYHLSDHNADETFDNSEMNKAVQALDQPTSFLPTHEDAIAKMKPDKGNPAALKSFLEDGVRLSGEYVMAVLLPSWENLALMIFLAIAMGAVLTLGAMTGPRFFRWLYRLMRNRGAGDDETMETDEEESGEKKEPGDSEGAKKKKDKARWRRGIKAAEAAAIRQAKAASRGMKSLSVAEKRAEARARMEARKSGSGTGLAEQDPDTAGD